ncbi:unnamed protein product [Choristocarpus tenellus]
MVSEFKKGAIVRLTMHNFLSNRDTTVRFGPRLNMVLGPNGSGKSTLVCAMALGLGGNPKVLARADNLSDFVMHEKDKAWVELELFIPDGDNITICRSFKRGDNKSEWKVNGRYAQCRCHPLSLTANLGIQVENLCTFLPQDKVGDFSGFAPEQLLVETQKALGEGTLNTKHLELIRLQESAGKSESEERQVRQHLDQLIAQNEGRKRDVERLRQREEHLTKVALLQKRKLWLEIEELQRKGVEAQAKKKAADEELRLEKLKHQPLQDKVDTWKLKQDKAKGAFRRLTDESRILSENLTRTLEEKARRGLEAAKAAKVELKNLEKRRREKEKQLENYQSMLVELERTLAAHEDKVAQGTSLEDLGVEENALSLHITELRNEIAELRGMKQELNQSLREADIAVKRLQNVRAQREVNLKTAYNNNAETALKMVAWAGRNQEKLRGNVWGPIGVDVSVENKDDASCLEMHVPKHLWFALVVENKEDHDTLVHHFRGEQAQINIITCDKRGAIGTVHRKYTEEFITNLKATAGIKGYLDECIQCPDPIRQVLMDHAAVHNVLLGNAETEKVIQTDTRFLDSITTQGYGVVFAAVRVPQGGNVLDGHLRYQRYNCNRSLYSKKLSSSVVEVPPPRVLGRGSNEEAISHAIAECTHLENECKRYTEKVNLLELKIVPFKDRKEELGNKRMNMITMMQTISHTKAKINRLKGKVRHLEVEIAEGGDGERVKYINRLDKSFHQQANSVSEAQDVLSAILQNMSSLVGARMSEAVAKEVHNALQHRLDGVKNVMQDKAVEAESAAKTVRNYKTLFNERKRKVGQEAPLKHPNGVSTEFGKMWNSLPSTMELLETEMEMHKSAIDDTMDNPELIKEYEECKEKIKHVEAQLKDLETSNGTTQRRMEDLEKPWEEELMAAVRKLSTLFEMYMKDMQCQGEVGLRRCERFRDWGLDIRVRFRMAETVALKTLSHQIHSGGERSVSTILFLMALQDLQESPFRVVDEINQGMDPANERLVFSRIVQNSCGPERHQYFLITPKLLQGLVAMDNDDITVLFINNGPYSLRGTEENCTKTFIERKRRADEKSSLIPKNQKL